MELKTEATRFVPEHNSEKKKVFGISIEKHETCVLLQYQTAGTHLICTTIAERSNFTTIKCRCCVGSV